MRTYLNHIDDLVVDAVVGGTMDAQVVWHPVEAITLSRKIRYHERAVKAAPFWRRKQQVKDRLQKLQDELNNLDINNCRKFYTKIRLTYDVNNGSHGFGYSRQGYTPLSGGFVSRNVNIHFYIDFSGNTIKIQWYDENNPGSKRSRVDEKYYLLPSLIPARTTMSQSNVIRYHYDQRDHT